MGSHTADMVLYSQEKYVTREGSHTADMLLYNQEKYVTKHDKKTTQISSMQPLLLSILVLCLLIVYLLVTLPRDMADSVYIINNPSTVAKPGISGENDRPVIGTLWYNNTIFVTLIFNPLWGASTHSLSIIYLSLLSYFK